MLPLVLISVLLLGFASLAIISVQRRRRRAEEFGRTAHQASATIVNIIERPNLSPHDDSGPAYYPVVSFKDQGGNEQTAFLPWRYDSTSIHVGQRVQILYAGDDPSLVMLSADEYDHLVGNKSTGCGFVALTLWALIMLYVMLQWLWKVMTV